ncbi:MAG: class I SAM-dependent methyltransferase [Chitinophagaceae bacterium]
MARNKPPAWLYKRTSVLNILHRLHLAAPHSQMTEDEMNCLQRHATGKHKALEIGTYMGVTANIIAGAMAPDGELTCVDPFAAPAGQTHPGLQMTLRQLKRNKLLPKVKFLQGFSTDAAIKAKIPDGLDLMLVDGDHSYAGIQNDWDIVCAKLQNGGILCLHDTTIPAAEPYKNFGSVEFYNKIVQHDSRFRYIETVYSMNVLQKIS